MHTSFEMPPLCSKTQDALGSTKWCSVWNYRLPFQDTGNESRALDIL